MNNNLIYNIKDKPKTIKEWCLYSLQMVLSVFVATVLIAQICGTPIPACLLGAGLGTLVYQLITRFRSPMFISSCGATVSAVIGALALPAIGDQNYLMVFVGGVTMAGVYALCALLVKKEGVGFINKILPPSIVGAVTIVIGLNLAKFIPGYCEASSSLVEYFTVIDQITGEAVVRIWAFALPVLIAIAVMIVVALSSHYLKGFAKTVPFLIGIIFGYIVCLILKACGIPIVSFEAFENLKWVPKDTFLFLNWHADDFTWGNFRDTLLFFIPVALCGVCEHLSDHNTLSNIIGVDLKEEPGLDKTLLGNAASSLVGTTIGGLPQTSYGEGIATIGFSKVASVWITTCAAAFIALLSFVPPVTAFIQSIPKFLFGGCAMCLYGYIAASGLKTLINNKVDLEDNKNLIIVSVVLTVGVGGLFLFSEAFTGVSLAMVLGIILNLILRTKKEQ